MANYGVDKPNGYLTDAFCSQVMRSYLSQIFDAVNLSAGGKSGKKLGPIKMPASVTHAVSTYITTIGAILALGRVIWRMETVRDNVTGTLRLT